MKNGFVLVKVEMTTCLSNQHLTNKLTTVLGILWKTLHLQKKQHYPCYLKWYTLFLTIHGMPL
nr:MAG TPA: hypothetical protein [Caudoviricetes sp.]